MKPILKNYSLLVKKYQKIEVDLTVNEIHDKRVILRRIFPILAAYKMKPSKVKNGEKAFKLFGKLRDIQVQVLKLEKIEQTPEIMDYLAFLKEREEELKEKVRKFFKKKELEFPVLKKKNKPDKSKIIEKTNHSLNKLIERIRSRSIDDAEDIHKIRIEFKKFRYKVEILSHIGNIEEAKIDMLKMYQDKLGEIQDYDVLINGIKKYCKKRKLDEDEMIGLFEQEQNTLIENFDNQIELFIAVCRDVMNLNKEEESPEEENKTEEETTMSVGQPDINKKATGTSVEGVGRIIESLAQNAEMDKSNHETSFIKAEITGVETEDIPLKVTIKPKRKRISDKSVDTDTNQQIE